MTIFSRKRAIVEDSDIGASSSASPHKRSKGNNAAALSLSSSPGVLGTPAAPVASTSWASSSPSKSAKSASAFLTATPRKTPYTPYPAQPSDSPSNPFGRKRTQRLIRSLPPPSSFSKHVALRFQLVRLPKKGTSKSAINAMASAHRQGGVYRIARVPLNYTFVHLRCLISWLFNTPASYANSHSPQQEGNDYLFEVKNKIDIYGPLYKPGQIKAKSGVTVVKLSNVHDPARRWKSKYGLVTGAEDEDEDQEDELSEDDEAASDGEDIAMDNDDDWKWADEEDFTVGHCFPTGLKGDTGIIYHHSPTTQIHITVNKNLLPRQRGVSNTPHVFGARGYVHLSPAPLPRPLFSKSILDTLSSSPAPAPTLAPPKRRVSPLPAAFPPKAPKASAMVGRRATSSALAKGKSKAEVKLKSPTPPPRQAGNRNGIKRLKSPPPPPITVDEELTDADADGEADQEENEDDLHELDASHPFFFAQGSSALKPAPTRPKGEEDEEAEVIYVADSDEEQPKTRNGKEVIVISDSEDDSVVNEEKTSSNSLPYHLREDWNRLVDPEKFNDPPYLFAKYLLEYMDPKGYQTVRQAIKRGELDDKEVFTGSVDGQEGEDPFDDDDDDVVVVKKDKGKDKEAKPLEKGKRKKVDPQYDDEDYEDEDENMIPSLHVIEDDIDEEDEEEDGVRLEQPSAMGSTPGLTNATSISSSSLPPSSPPRNSSPGPGDPYSHPYSRGTSAFSLSTSSLPDILLSSEVILSEHYPNKKYTFTPAPPKGKTKRMRLERLVKRLARAKKGEYLSKYDEKEEASGMKDQAEAEEVDELADDDCVSVEL